MKNIEFAKGNVTDIVEEIIITGGCLVTAEINSKEISQENAFVYPKAALGKRILAYIVDGIIGGLPVTVLIIAVLVPFLSYGQVYDYNFNTFQSASNITMVVAVVAALIIGGGWSIIYFLFRDGFGNGQSWGKKMCSLMVVNLDDNMPCNKSKSFVRNIFAWIISAVFSWAPGLNLLASIAEPIVAIIHDKGQRVSDMVARTQVIEIELYRGS
jgi:uncharacterized RDD family membrane protein YckC